MISTAATLATVWLGTLFVYTGAGKLADHRHAATALDGYRLLPPLAARVVARPLPSLELGAGLALLSSPFHVAGAVVAASLGVAFAAASVSVLVRKIEGPCGCSAGGGERVTLMTPLRAVAIVAASGVSVAGSGVPDAPIAIVLAALAGVPALLGTARSWRHRRTHYRPTEPRVTAAEIARLTRLLATETIGDLNVALPVVRGVQR